VVVGDEGVVGDLRVPPDRTASGRLALITRDTAASFAGNPTMIRPIAN
jgi:hypothetical protein